MRRARTFATRLKASPSGPMVRRNCGNLAAPGGITVALLVAALAWDASGLDLAFAHLAGGARGFAWRDSWLLSTVLHEGGRCAALILAIALCVAVRCPFGTLARIGGRERLQLAVSTLLGALVVSLLKRASHTSCPWDLADFGGFAHYASHWSFASDGGQGSCFPAGHATCGFAFIGGYFAFRESHPQWARRWLLGSLVAGIVLGLAQQWRGAHFMSHTLWSAVACWGTAALVHAAWPRNRVR
jgi:membrane-associated PAP2 superfamily phosphatase